MRESKSRHRHVRGQGFNCPRMSFQKTHTRILDIFRSCRRQSKEYESFNNNKHNFYNIYIKIMSHSLLWSSQYRMLYPKRRYV
jgi:hypothetical protein